MPGNKRYPELSIAILSTLLILSGLTMCGFVWLSWHDVVRSSLSMTEIDRLYWIGVVIVTFGAGISRSILRTFFLFRYHRKLKSHD
jgi:hypothetical protein